MKEQHSRKREAITIGLDLGERRHRFCVLGSNGQVLEEGSVGNSRAALSELSGRYAKALIVMEAGCHSPWVSRHLEQAGCEVVVSNPRKTRAIYQHERKSDRRDALMLARIARMEPALLYPVRHGSEEAQQDLLRIKLRDSLVRARVGLINSLRFYAQEPGLHDCQSIDGAFSQGHSECAAGLSCPDDRSQHASDRGTLLADQATGPGDSHSGSQQVSRDDLAGADPRSGPDHCALLRFEDWRPGSL